MQSKIPTDKIIAMADAGDELIDYEEEEETTVQLSAPSKSDNKDSGVEKGVKKGYVGIHSTGFRDFLLKPELLRAIADCGFEHPSEGSSILPGKLTVP